MCKIDMRRLTMADMVYKGFKDRVLYFLGFRKVPTYSWFTGEYFGYKWRHKFKNG